MYNTCDFSTVYTTLDLQDLVTCLGDAVREAFQGHHYTLLLDTAASTLYCKWEDEDAREAAVDPDSLYLRASDVTNLVRTLVLGTYIKNGSHTRKQIKGVSLRLLIQLLT